MKKCPKCRKEYEETWEYCTECDIMLEAGEAPKEASSGPLPVQETTFYNTSIKKLVILSICSLGIYEVYWFYKNWKAVRESTGEKLSPLARGIFAIFFCHNLFQRIITNAKKSGFSKVTSAGALATVYVVLVIIANAMGRVNSGIIGLDLSLWLLSYLTIIPIAIAQDAVNFRRQAVDPEVTIDGRFSWKAVLLIIFGGAIFLMSILGAFIPEEMFEEQVSTETLELMPSDSLGAQ